MYYGRKLHRLLIGLGRTGCRTAEDHAVSNSDRAEADHAVDTARHFASGEETGDHVVAGIQHLSLVVDLETAT